MNATHIWKHLLAMSAAVTAIALATTGRAVEVTFDLDDTLSHLGLVGSFLDVELLEQHPGSLDTTYSGTITVDVDDPLDPSTITVLGRVMTAANSDDLALPDAAGGPAPSDPGIPEPGMYSMFIDGGIFGLAYATAREVVYDMTSFDPEDVNPPVPLAVTAGMFEATQWLTYSHGFFDVNLAEGFGGQNDRDDLTGDGAPSTSAEMASYTVDGDTATLTIPYDLTGGDPGGLVLTYDGVFIATASVGGIPGDFDGDGDGDGDVDGDDFLEWQTGFGTIYDGDDFLVWQQNFPTPGGGTGSGAVPEPASLGMAIWLGLALVRIRMPR